MKGEPIVTPTAAAMDAAVGWAARLTGSGGMRTRAPRDLGKTPSSKWNGSQTVKAAEAENSMGFIKTDAAAFLQVRGRVEEAQYKLSRPPGTAVPMTAEPVIMAQLQQLGQLRDAGVLTEQEFASKKAELLSRL